jgi:hypothetical protein
LLPACSSKFVDEESIGRGLEGFGCFTSSVLGLVELDIEELLLSSLSTLELLEALEIPDEEICTSEASASDYLRPSSSYPLK